MDDIQKRLNAALAAAARVLKDEAPGGDGVESTLALLRGLSDKPDQQTRLPALKVHSPDFIVKRLVEGQTVGLLSQRRHIARLGDPQALVNEVGTRKDLGGASVWAIVSQAGPVPVASVAKLDDELREGLDPATLEEFAGVDDFFYTPLRLLAKFDPPLRLRRTPLGKRYASTIDFSTDVELDVPVAKDFVQEPDGGRLRAISDEALVALRIELRDMHADTEDEEERSDVLNAHAFVLAEANRRSFDLDVDADEVFLTETLAQLSLAADAGNTDAAEVVKHFTLMQRGSMKRLCSECGEALAVVKRAPRAGMSREQLESAREARSRQYGIEVLSSGSSLTFPSGFPTNLQQYGDPVNLKYPVNTVARARSARVRFKQFASAYKKRQSKAVIHERIVRAELRFGVTPSYDPNNDLDKLLPGSIKEKLSKKVTKQDLHVHSMPGGGQTGTAQDGPEHVHSTPDGDTSSPITVGGGAHIHEMPDGDVTGQGMAPAAEEGEARPDREEMSKSERPVRLLKADTSQDTGGEKDERFVFGVVLVPDEVDSQGETYTADEVRKAAHSFMEHFGGIIKVMHQGRAIDGIKVIETYVTKQKEAHGGETLPVGTWLMGTRVQDDELWMAVKRGEFTGYSIGGTALRERLSSR